MEPNALLYLSTATGKQKYLAFCRKSVVEIDILSLQYEDSLYFRQAKSFNKKEKNGK